MPRPLEICIEELNGSREEEPFIRCVALPGGEPGLSLDREGQVRWMPDEAGDYGLWVSADDRLVLLRGEGAGPAVVERQSRSLEAPVGQPVILLDEDVLVIDGRRLMVHFHGETEVVREPERLSRSALGQLARAAAVAASLALGGTAAMAAGTGGGKVAGSQVGTPAPIEVRVRPPAPMPSTTNLDCTVTSQKGSAKGPLVIEADCANPRGLKVGQGGQLIDTKSGNHVKDGHATIKSINGKKVRAEAPALRKPVDAKVLRFWVRMF